MNRNLFQLVAAVQLSGVVALAGNAPCQEADVSRERATNHYRKGALAAAVTELQHAVSSCPDEPFLKFMLGNALYRTGKIEAAAAEYEASLRLKPNYFEALMSAGFARFEVDQARLALTHFRQATQLDPQSPFARAALAIAFYTLGDNDNALIQHEQAVRLDTRYSDPEALAIDIRWKPKSREILGRIRTLQQKRNREDQ